VALGIIIESELATVSSRAWRGVINNARLWRRHVIVAASMPSIVVVKRNGSEAGPTIALASARCVDRRPRLIGGGLLDFNRAMAS